MPNYSSKSQKRSQSKSKNGGRRKKQTMRKLRRGRKSRKVMRGGVTPYVMTLSNKSQRLYNILLLDNTINDRNNLEDLIFNSSKYSDDVVKGWYNDLFDTYPPEKMSMTDIGEAIITKLEAGNQ